MREGESQEWRWVDPVAPGGMEISCESCTFIESGLNAMTNREVGSIPLHSFVRVKCMELARFLIEHGADTAARDEDGNPRCVALGGVGAKN